MYLVCGRRIGHVGATDRTEAKAWYSELPSKPDMKAVAAPGGA